jgi:hypothetical protein
MINLIQFLSALWPLNKQQSKWFGYALIAISLAGFLFGFL